MQTIQNFFLWFYQSVNDHLTAILAILAFISVSAISSAIYAIKLIKGYDPLNLGLHRLNVWDRLQEIKARYRLYYYRRLIADFYPSFDEKWIFDSRSHSKKEGFSKKGTIDFEYERLKIAMIGNKVGDSLFRDLRLRLFKFKYLSVAILVAAGIFTGFYMRLLPESMQIHPSALLAAGAVIVALYNALFVSNFQKKPLFFSYFLPEKLIDQDQLEEIDKHLHETLYEEIPDDCPPDLRDRRRMGIVDKNGAVVDGQILPSDISKPMLFQDVVEFQRRVNFALGFSFIGAAIVVWALLQILGV